MQDTYLYVPLLFNVAQTVSLLLTSMRNNKSMRILHRLQTISRYAVYIIILHYKGIACYVRTFPF